MGTIETLTHKNVTAFYPKGMQGIARQCAKQITRQLVYIHDVTGFESFFTRFNLYIKPVDRTSMFDVWAFLEARNTVGVILYLDRRDESYEAIVATNFWYPCSHMHEIVELSLTSTTKIKQGYRRKPFGGVQRDDFYFTRWFREGFAEYAGFLAYKMTVFDDSFARDKFPIGMYQLDLRRHPFSSLTRVGKDLFAWHQLYKNYPTPLEPNPNLPHVGKTRTDYYSAAWGLFMVIEDRYGRKAIKEIILEINRLKDLDGEALKEIVSRAINTDIVKLVEDFRFPETGLHMDAYWPGHRPKNHTDSSIEGLWVILVGPDSPAQRAGVRKGDVVLSLNGEPTLTNLDFELALFKLRNEKSVKLGIWREGVGEISVELKLGK